MGKKDESVVLSLFQKFLRNSIYNRINVLYNGHEIPMKAADMTDPKPLRRVFGTKYYFFSPLIEHIYDLKGNISMKDHYYLFVNGKRVEVTEEVYREFYRITEHEKYLKKKALVHECSLEEMASNGETVGASVSDTEREALTSLMRARVREMISKLSDEEKMLVKLRFYDQMTEREAARAMGIPQSTFHCRLSSLYRKLRKKID